MFRRAFVAVALGTVVLGLATPALAHVTVQPGEATRGGFATVAFQVPNERDDANTVQLEVTFPADHPIPFVSTQPVEGWNVSVERTPLETPIGIIGVVLGGLGLIVAIVAMVRRPKTTTS